MIAISRIFDIAWKKMLPEYNNARQELKELFLFMGRGIIFQFLGYKLYLYPFSYSNSSNTFVIKKK